MRLGGAVTAERVLRNDERTLQQVGLSHRKAGTIRALAERMFDDGLDAGTLATMTGDEILTTLAAVPGMRPPSVGRLLLHFLHRPDVFLASDPCVREAIPVLDRPSRDTGRMRP